MKIFNSLLMISLYLCVFSTSFSAPAAYYTDIDVFEIGCSGWGIDKTEDVSTKYKSVDYDENDFGGLIGQDLYVSILVHGTASYYEDGLKIYYKATSSSDRKYLNYNVYREKVVVRYKNDDEYSNVPESTIHYWKIKMSDIMYSSSSSYLAGNIYAEVETNNGIKFDYTNIKIVKNNSKINLSVNFNKNVYPELSWNPITLDNGVSIQYNIYRSFTGIFSTYPIDTITETYFEDFDNRYTNKIIYYKIIGFEQISKDQNRVSSEVIHIDPITSLENPIISISSIGNDYSTFPKLHWKKVFGAEKYEIHVNRNNSGYSLLDETSSNEYYDYKYIVGSNDIYKIKPKNRNIDGTFSNEKEFFSIN